MSENRYQPGGYEDRRAASGYDTPVEVQTVVIAQRVIYSSQAPADTTQIWTRQGDYIVPTGRFHRNGKVVYVGSPEGEPKLYADTKGGRKVVRRETFRRDHPVLSVIGRSLRFMLKVLWTILKILCAIYWLVKLTEGIRDVEQTFGSGPNSIQTTNANVNRYISQQGR